MDYFLNILGLLLSILAGITVLRTVRMWQGQFRDELMFLCGGFVFMALGFFWDGFIGSSFLPGLTTPLFVFGVTLFALGSSRIFTFTAGG